LASFWVMAAYGQGGLPILPPITPWNGSKKAELPFKNVQVLLQLNEIEFSRVMAFITEALGVKCTYCHNADHYATDEKPHKPRAREMLRMVQLINRTFFKNERVTCFTCHAAKPDPPWLPQGFQAIPSLLADKKPRQLPLARYTNVQRLSYLSEGEYFQVMAFFVSATGAGNCNACHNPASFASDESQRKLRAREMIVLVQQVTPEFFKRERLNCFTCHQGRMEPKTLPDNWLPGWKE
jgi:hypothetical protein